MPMTVLSWMLIVVASIGCCASLASTLAVRRFRRAASGPPEAPTTSVTILKPLHGSEPDLHDNLSSFVEQQYAGDVQIVFGVCGAADTANPIVHRLIDEHPRRDIELVIGRPALNGNGKVANPVGVSKAIRHDCLVVSDSDMRVGPDYLTRVVAATGLVLDHVNAHKHFHLHPTIARLVVGIGRRYGMNHVRVPFLGPACWHRC